MISKINVLVINFINYTKKIDRKTRFYTEIIQISLEHPNSVYYCIVYHGAYYKTQTQLPRVSFKCLQTFYDFIQRRT